MRHLILFIALATILSCNQNDSKQNEIEIKEKYLNPSEKDSINSPVKVDTVKTIPDQETTPQPLVLTPLKIDGNIGYITFSQNNKTVFYFDAASKKGKINLNGVEYILTKMEGSYTLSGNNVTITTTKGKWKEMDSDCAYGKALIVTIKMGTRVLQLKDIEVQDCSSMAE